MKRNLLKVLALLCAAAAAAQESPAPTLAVFELRTKDIDQATMLQYLDALTGAFHRTGRVVVLDRGRREELLGEIEFALSEAADDRERIAAGKQLSAALVLAGSIGLYNEARVVNLRILETATGKIIGSADEVYDDEEDLFEDADDIAQDLLRKAVPERARAPARPDAVPKPPAAPRLPDEDFAEPRGIEVFPFQLSLWAPIQLVPSTTRIVGARVTLVYSDNVSLVGLDAGVIGRVSGDVLGLQANLINLTGSCRGVQTGILGIAESIFVLQANAVYNKAGTLWGAQVGIVNTAGKCVGAQIGIVNVAGLLRGVQIGLVNIVRYGEQAGFMPFVNIRF